MKILVVGSGGREHTLAWKINQSPKVEKIYAAPGNAGIGEIAECVDLKATDVDGLVALATGEGVDLTVVGPEDPLNLGMVDRFESEGMKIFGPSKMAAQIEASKAFAKQLMEKYGIPTAEYRTFRSAPEAKAYIHERGAPIVVKASGLAAGKGAIVAMTEADARDAVDMIMVERAFGEAGDEVVVEEYLEGEEASVFCITDGRNIQSMISAQDHKRAFDGDQGPNTGGMGAYSPAPIVTEEMQAEIEKKILQPTVRAMAEENRPYKGVLYGGLIFTKEGPKALEFNCRFGDPEAQVTLPMLETDLVDLLLAVCDGDLSQVELKERKGAAVCVVMASGGYPGEYKTGKKIYGLEEAAAMEDVVVFHAGTARSHGDTVTSGGRVLGVTALGPTIQNAISKAYEATDRITFENVHYRRDIGYRALNRS